MIILILFKFNIIHKFQKMNKNYYDILALKRDASDEEVSENYKKMVLRWHPKFSKEDQSTAYHHFSLIS